MSTPTPETDAFYSELYAPSVPADMIEHASGKERDQMRKLERERDAAQEKLSTVYQWIERHHQDGFTDSMTYWQNLERIGDKYSDRIDDAERQRDAAREDAERLAKGLAHMQKAKHHMGKPFDHLCICAQCEGAREALAAHEALAKK